MTTAADIREPDHLRPARTLRLSVADPAVALGVQQARAAYAELRWHPALRRRADEVRAEVAVRAAAFAVSVDGARVPIAVLRTAPGHEVRDPSIALASGALRAYLTIDSRVEAVTTAPLQLLATMHVAAAGGLTGGPPAEALGRPRPGTASMLTALAGLITARTTAGQGAAQSPPGAVLAAITHAEIVLADAFPPVSRVMGFVLARGLVRAVGLDPLGVGLPEAVAAGDPAGYTAALAEYPYDPAAWCRWWLGALTGGADHGRAAADTVSAGRFA